MGGSRMRGPATDRNTVYRVTTNFPTFPRPQWRPEIETSRPPQKIAAVSEILKDEMTRHPKSRETLDA